jgi:hypothetical protein
MGVEASFIMPEDEHDQDVDYAMELAVAAAASSSTTTGDAAAAKNASSAHASRKL